MDVILIVLFALLGIAVGSFLNVCIDRLPAGKSLVHLLSHCDSCQLCLSLKDLIPVFSYLWLRGRCHYCQVSISQRVFWLELGSGLFFAFLYWYYGLGVEFVLNAFYYCLFVVLGIIDLEHKRILNNIVYPAAGVVLIIDALLPQPGIVNGVIGGATGLVELMILAPVFRGGMGWGDVKMAALIGLVTGFPLVVITVFLGIVLGGLVAGVLLLLRAKKREETIPFGPFLSLATMATLLWGDGILNWYMGLF